MSVETDALAEAALRFSEAIRAERTSTFDALASERQAAIKIIEALRAERERRSLQAGGRFVFGVALGAAVGIAAIYFVSQRASEEARLGLTASPDAPASTGEALSGFRERLRLAFEDGRRAAASEEQQLWERYRKQLTEGQGPPPVNPDDVLF